MPVAKDLEHVFCEMDTQSTLPVNPLQMLKKGYVAIELKALAVSWACEKFHHFLYGSYFTLQTDQKPLESILARSLNEATPRLQGLVIKASAYDFNVEYIPGPTNQVLDCLSHLGCIKYNIVLLRVRVNAIT